MEATPEHPLPVKPKRDAIEWVKLLMGGGLGVVIAWAAVRYLMTEGKENANFMRTTVKENTTALTEVKAAIEDQERATTNQTTVQAASSAAEVVADQHQTAALNSLADEVKALTVAAQSSRKSTDKLTKEFSDAAEAENPP